MSYRICFAPGLFARKVMVVGAAVRASDAAPAHELASLGAQVVLLGRKAEKLEAVPPRSKPTEVSHLAACDIRQEDTVVDGGGHRAKPTGKSTAW